MTEEIVKKLEGRIELLEFKFELLLEDSASSRLLIDYNITREEYKKLGNLLDKYRDMIECNERVSSMKFEKEAIDIIHNKGDYHFCEHLAKELMEEGSWEEIFPALYSSKVKYKHYMKKRKENE